MFQCEIIAPLCVQKSPRFARGHVYDPSKKDKERIQWQVKPFAPAQLIDEPCVLHIQFFFPIPKATSKKIRALMLAKMILPDIRPDLSNLAYLVENALTGLVYDDDKRVCRSIYEKFYSEKAKLIVQVWPIFPKAV